MFRPSDLAILVPVLNRPQNVAPLLEAVATTAPCARVVFIADDDDRAELDALEVARLAFDCEYITAPPGTNYATKINWGYTATDEPLFFMAADDVRFRADWFARATDLLSEQVAVVGTQDLLNGRVKKGSHSTHTLVAREYIDTVGGVWDEPPGKVLHEGYRHEYCDDEFVQVAILRERFAMAFDAVVEHLHPLNDTAPDDATYQLGREGTGESRALYRQRRKAWLNANARPS